MISYQNVGNNTALLTDFDATMIKDTRSIDGDNSNISVIRDGSEILCSEVYVSTDDDLAIKDGTVNDKQKGKKEQT